MSCEFEDFEERLTSSNEDIANKTGTFHLEVNCQKEATIGEYITCVITAQVEDSQLMEKEVDFNCYILEGSSSTQHSLINFNKMITREEFSISKDFFLPTTLVANLSHIVKCEANYYNKGSRQDTFLDSFIANLPSGGGLEVIKEVQGFIDEIIEDIKDIIDDVNEKRKTSLVWQIVYYLCIFIIVLIIILLSGMLYMKICKGNKK